LRAVVYSEYGALPTLQEVPEPRCPADGVVVAVEATGVCRSDWHAWMGHDPVALPHLPGRRPGHRPLRLWLRHLPRMPRRELPGLPEPDTARVHPLGLLR
jgi:hypothetical protein